MFEGVLYAWCPGVGLSKTCLKVRVVTQDGNGRLPSSARSCIFIEAHLIKPCDGHKHFTVLVEDFCVCDNITYAVI